METGHEAERIIWKINQLLISRHHHYYCHLMQQRLDVLYVLFRMIYTSVRVGWQCECRSIQKKRGGTVSRTK